MRILLIFPPLSLDERYNANVGDVGGYLAPLGLCQMAAILLEDGHDVQVMDCPVNHYNLTDIIERVRQFQPGIVGVSAVTSLYDKTIKISEAIREKFPSILVLIGGPHTKLSPEKILEETHANIVLVGDADITIREIAKNKEKYMAPQVVHGEVVKDLDSLPYPARHLLDMSRYTAFPNNWKETPHVFQVMATRGCAFHCTFCASANSNYRRRSVRHVIGELKELKRDYDAKEVAFWDDIFTMKRDWVMEFCQALKEENINLLWSCETRVHLVDPELLQAMKKAGCWNILFGIEAADQDLLNNIRKGTTPAAILKGVRMVQDAGIEVRGTFMLGLPGETPEKAKRTIDFAVELDCDYSQFTLCTPFPGTELYLTADKWGSFVDKSHENQTELSAVFVPHGYSSQEELRRLFKGAYRKFYLRPGYVYKRLKKIRTFSDIKRNVLGLRAILGFADHW